MKCNTRYNGGFYKIGFSCLIILSVVLNTIILTGIPLSIQAQGATYAKPIWWFGAAAGANFNFHRGSIQQLNSNLTTPVSFSHGYGSGLYLAPLVEFHIPDSRWGIMLQAGYDSRKALFQETIAGCNCPADLSTNLTYVTVEPSLRLAPFNSGFYLYAGPRLAFTWEESFIYKQGTNPAIPDPIRNPDIKGDFSNTNKTLISMQVGGGYDIPLSSKSASFQTIFSPFVSFQPYFGQSPRSNETWKVYTARVGAALKFGAGRRISMPAPTTTMPSVDKEVRFSVNSPRNIPTERRVRETFSVLNYVFFDIGSTEIPDCYVMLRKNQVKDFKEDQLEVFTPKKLSGRSNRELAVYYNVLNILGDRMGKNPATTIVLVGSSELGPEDGRAMAETTKRYLTDIFGIDPSRIAIEGRDKPKILSEQLGSTRELDLLREEDRRVSIESSSPALLMEFQSGPAAQLKPVEIVAVQHAPLDSYVSFHADGAKEAFSSWSLQIKDEKGALQSFGPYTQEIVSIPGKSILGSRPEGNYRVKMIGQSRSGNTVTKETMVHMVLWTPTKNEEGMRYSVLFGFNESKTIAIYEKYLAEIVTPKIPKGSLVIIHGYTDIIGDESNNQRLSLSRANEVKRIIERSLAVAGRKDVKIDIYGFGEDDALSPFANNYPEERFYNRTVIIDIIPPQ